MNEKAFQKFLATGEYAPTEDSIPWQQFYKTNLEQHDARFHPNGYKEGDSCKYRESLAKGDTTDLALSDAEYAEERIQEKEKLARIRASEAGMSLAEKREKRIAEAKAKGEPLDYADRYDAELEPLFYGIYDEDEIVEDCFKDNSNLGDSDSRGWLGRRKVYGYGSIPNDITDAFVEFARSHGGDPDKAIDTPKALAEAGYEVRGGRRKNELKLMKKIKPTYPYFNTVEDLHFSWRPKNLPRKKTEPSMATLLSKVTDPFQKQMFQYFNSLININPTYATEPNALVGYLQGYNGQQETSNAQFYGPEVQKFFQHIRDTPYDEAVEEMGKIMKEYAESPVMAKAKKDQTGMRNAGRRSLDLRQSALYD